MNYIQYFDIQLSSTEKRNIKGIELENKIKIILISDPDINISSCSVAVGAGYLQDDFQGTAHFLEHLLFMGSEKYPEQNDYHSYVQINGGSDNAFTSDNMTCYYLNLETSFLKKGIEMLSWFFKSPLLDEKHINSEMEIIDSEHKKNILADNWIMDDIFKNFIKSDNKYKKFGTGNLQSLKNITKQDILDFYNKYYTTDNIYVCVVDSKNIDQMILEYLIYFEEIPLKLYNGNDDRFIKNNFETIEKNIIFYNASSEYIFINFYLIVDAIEKNTIQYQLVLFLNYLIGSEYYASLSYYLKENDIIKNLSCLLEYFYDYQAILNLQVILIEKKYNSFLQTYYSLIKFLNFLKKISEDEFIELYNNYVKIKMLSLLYDSNNDPISVSNMVVENMIKGNISEAIIRFNYVPEYSKIIYNNFLQMVNKINIKITTNYNFANIDPNKFAKSQWYNSTFFPDNISTKIFKQTENFNKKYHLVNRNNINGNKIKLIDWDFNLTNIIGIKNFMIKNYIIESVDRSILPELIDDNKILKRKIYLQEFNKFGKPLSNITIMRRNIELLKKENKLIVGIYIELCEKILNYFLETMGNYKLSFSISINREYLIYNFYGIQYQLLFFVSQIISKIHPDTFFLNLNLKKYFNEIIRDSKEYINNFKYNSPYIICTKYIGYLFDNNLLPEDKLNFLSNLTFDDFKNKISKCFKYSQEYYILIGIKKYGHGFSFNINKDDEYNYYEDNYMISLIEMFSLNHKKYLLTNNDYDNIETMITLDNYKINKENINPNEINNCMIRYWCLDIIDIGSDYIKDKIDLEIGKKIIKKRIVLGIVSEILNEPLFDKIRTIDKLGYIVKSDFKTIINNNKVYYLVLFLIQSSYSIKKISDSIEDFNDYIIKDLRSNYENYLEKFRLLKESKLLEFSKPISDLSEEISVYIDAISNKIYNFNLNTLFLDECKKIDFEKDIGPEIININKKKAFYSNIILEKKID
jgi:insulysin